MEFSLYKVLFIILFLYGFLQIIIIFFTSGITFGETKNMLRMIRAHEMFKQVYADSNEKFGISDIDESIEQLVIELNKPLNYIWFSNYFKMKSLINTLYAMRQNYTELVRWYDEEVKNKESH